jgi:transposase
MTNLALRGKQRPALENIVAHTTDARMLRRAYALLECANGISPQEIATQLGVERQTIYNWANRLQERKDLPFAQRLDDAPRSGRPCTAQGIIDDWLDEIIDTDPRLLGYRATVWTAPLLVHYLVEHHQIDVSCQSVHLALARLRIRWKRPRYGLALRPATWRQAKGG